MNSGVVASDDNDKTLARKPVRLLIVCSTLHVGGAESVAALLARRIDRSRFEVTVCCLKENGVVGEEIQRAGVEVIAWPRRPGKVDYLTFRKLLRVIRQRRIEVIHSHDVHGLLDSAICRTLSPRVRHVHTFHYGNYPRTQGSLRRIERLTWRRPDALVAVGHEQGATISRAYGIPQSRLRVLWNGVDTTPASIADEVRQAIAGDDRPVIASISTLIEQKGLPLLLEAAARLRAAGRRFLLLVIGDGYLRGPLQQQVHSLGLDDSVRLLGWVTEASRRALPACNIFVQSSLWEAMSVVVLEAMAAAKPMVVTRVGENAHAVQHEQTGLLVPPGDAAALADALQRLLDDRELARRIGSAARASYESQFTAAHMVQRYERLYAELVSERQAERARPRK